MPPIKIEKHLLNLIGKIYGGFEGVVKIIFPSEDKEDREIEKNRDIILFVGKIYAHMVDAIREYQKQEKTKFRIALLHDSRLKLDSFTQNAMTKIDLIIACDTNSSEAIQKSLLPYVDEILAVTTRAEDQVPLFARVIPFLPYNLSPTTESLNWTTDKLLTRERIEVFDQKINPRFCVVAELKPSTIKDLKEKVGFPMIVKPSGLGASRLVSICYHEDELKEVLDKTFKTVDGVYKETNGTGEVKILIEHFIDGELYSLDGYVTGDGIIHFCPICHIKTGKRIGFDDFFGYQQITPTQLKKESIVRAEFVAAEAIHAVGLRNTTAHVELLKAEDGWKVVEIGPRVGGFRHMMYEFSYGINHTMNDILIRTGARPKIFKKASGYTVAMKFFAKNEGRLTKLTGTKKAQELKSFKRIYINKKIGDKCKFAKHGGSSVFNIIMFNRDRSELLADIRRLEQMIVLETN